MVNPKQVVLQEEEEAGEDPMRRSTLRSYEQEDVASRLIQKLFRHRCKKVERKDHILLPILIIPGIASSGLKIEHSGVDNKRHAGRRVWMDAAFLAASRLKPGVLNKEEMNDASVQRSQAREAEREAEARGIGERCNSIFQDAFEEVEASLQVRSAWLHHMSLSSNMVDERPGNQVRPYKGLAGIEFLSSDPVTKVGSWVHAPVTKYLVEEMGYEKGKNLDGAPYDWRLPPKATEQRDGYLTSTMQRVEEMYEANNGLPIVLVCHSMGCKMGHYFLNFCLDQKGQEWIDKYIHTYMPVGAPHCGVSLAIRAGVTGKGLNDQVDMLLEGDDEGLVLYKSWGSGAWLMPRVLPEHVVPCVIVRREGDLALRLVSSIQVGPLCAEREKPPKELRMTIVFRDAVRAHTDFVPVVYKTDPLGGNTDPLDATVTFDETFYIAVPMTDPELLGNLVFYLEEPGGRLHQNPTELHRKFRQYTSWGPIRDIKKKSTGMFRKVAKRMGMVWRVGMSTQPLMLRRSQFTHVSTDGSLSELNAEILICGISRDSAVSVEYDDDSHGNSYLSGVVQGLNNKLTEEIELRLDKVIGGVRVKARYQAPPNPETTPLLSRTSIAMVTPGSTPIIPIESSEDHTTNHPSKAIYAVWGGHNLLEYDGFCEPVFKLIQDYYERDPLGPTTRSAFDAPPVKRVRAIYGINVPTEVCAVYRHRPVVVVGDGLADSRYVVDTSATFPDLNDKVVQCCPWARNNLRDYKISKGRILETHQTLQTLPGKIEQKRCCGDGTVPYWNLIHCLSWKDKVQVLTVDELNQAEHRKILADSRFHALLKTYCKVRDPRKGAMFKMHNQHNNLRQMNKPGAGGIGNLRSALQSMSTKDK